ncbi:MAG TPA: RHS repeat-associated core domain-containing protein [Candidatus Angelobacter sp.]|nr:RHS repeat-associated core domain-containing protein [Candidatus Angelobacter sp.]
MTHDLTSGNNYTFDQENRITGAAGYTYTYDADGNRVEKSNGTTGTLYWYMTPGIVAESDLSGNLQSEYVFFNGQRVARRDLPSGNIAYYFSDTLKTASVITDATGNIKSESDYYPWGGELQFANGDSNHYKFTGKERDNETQLDYFGARYYGNALGRFITPDWDAKPAAVPYAVFGDPQSLNLYTYVRNVPTTGIDADGHKDLLDLLKQGACSIGISSACDQPDPKQQQNDKQKLINAQDNARANPAFQKDNKGTTHCNQATCYIVKAVGGPLAPLTDKNGNPLKANQQAENLANSKDYKEVTPQEAQKIADAGGLVVVAYDNPGGHGHLTTVRPEGVQGDDPPKGGKGPLLNDIGSKDRVQNQNYAFRKGSEIHFYTPK